MKHDDRCEAQFSATMMLGPCRCEVRALEAKLAALRPLVRAAVEWAEVSGSAPLLKVVLARNNAIDAARDLTPEQVAWAKGGE